jgi:O-antigen/teichoic acid export membrane protein
MSFIHRKASNLLTGIVLGPASFALLGAAQKGATVINQVTMSSINTMVVPSFSRVKERDKLGDLYIKMVSVTGFLVMPIFMGLAAVADPFVVVAFGDKFAPSATFMTISAFSIFPSVIAWFLPNLLISNAKTKDAFKLTLLNLITNIGVAGSTIWFGIEVMLTCLVVGAFLGLPFRLWLVNKHISLNFSLLFKSLIPPVVASLLMFFSLIELKDYLKLASENNVVVLVALVVSGGFLYPLFIYGIFFKAGKTYFRELKSMLLKGKPKKV